MPNCKPPIKNRFSSTNQPKKNGRLPGPSPTTQLRKLLERSISFKDPITKKRFKGKAVHVVALRLLYNACRGENEAIKEIFNRMDGRMSDVLIDQSTHITIDKRSILENARKAFTKGLV